MSYKVSISGGIILEECIEHVSFSVDDSRNSMIITGKVDTDESTVALYQWSLLKGTDSKCYKKIIVRQYQKDLLVREVTFSKAFVIDYSENYSNYSGTGTFTLYVRQLFNKDIKATDEETGEDADEVAGRGEQQSNADKSEEKVKPALKTAATLQKMLNNITDKLAKMKGTLDNSKGRKLNLEDFTDEILETKPMNSPVPEKWLGKKGGSIFIDDNGTWTYMNKEGQSVSYPNGYPDFSEYTHPTVPPVEIEVASPKNPQADFKAANEKAGLSKDSDPPVPTMNKPPDGYTWHHHQDGKTMILVDEDVHREFRHIGGQSTINGKNGTGE